MIESRNAYESRTCSLDGRHCLFYNYILFMKVLLFTVALLFTNSNFPFVLRSTFNNTIIFTQGIPVIDSNIKIIENYYQINSINQLLYQFKGKPVFIDLWATWCEPCLEEFRYNEQLHSFLDKKQIEMIYVSFDKKEFEDTLEIPVILTT